MVKSWDSGFAHMDSIPIVCPNCNQMVSVSGKVDGDEIVLSDCPNCDQQLTLKIDVPHGEIADGDPYIDMEFSCTVEWKSNDQNIRSSKWEFTGFDNPVDLFIKTLGSGCLAYGANDYPPTKMLHDTIMDLIESSYNPDTLDTLVRYIEALIDAKEPNRRQDPPESEG